MLCPKCKRKVLGDVCPDYGYKSAFKKMDDLSGTAPESTEEVSAVSVSIIPDQDKPAAGGFKPMDSLVGEVKKPQVTVYQEIPASGDFKPMDVLPGGETGKDTDTTPTNTGDKPAVGGFGPMNPLDTPDRSDTNGGAKALGTGNGRTTDPETKIRYRLSLNWKRWIPVIAGVSAVITVVLALTAVFSNILTRNKAEKILASALTVSGTNIEGEPELLAKIEQKNDFEINGLTKESSSYVAQVMVYSPDLYSIAKTLDLNNVWRSTEDVQKALESALDTAQPIQVQTSVIFDKTDKGYEPVLTTDFLDAYYGGVIQLYQDMLNEATREMG